MDHASIDNSGGSGASAAPARRITVNAIVPCWVNFAALLIELNNTCRTFIWSARIMPTSGGQTISIRFPFFAINGRPKDEGLIALDQIEGPKEVLEGQEATFQLRLRRSARQNLFEEELRVDVEIEREAWLGLDAGWHADEIIVNESRGKIETHWTVMMQRAVSECFRVLKPGRWRTIGSSLDNK